MKPIQIGAIAAAMFVALTAFIYWLQNGFHLVEPKKEYTHMHCPECQLEMAYNVKLEGKSCPQCGGSGPKLVPTIGPSQRKEAFGEIGPVGKLSVAAFLALLMTLASVYGWTLRNKARQQAEIEAQNRMLVCLCPFCKRRIGYHAKKQGTGTKCPRCKTAFALTEGEERHDAHDPGP